jgi:hypothetical protein
MRAGSWQIGGVQLVWHASSGWVGRCGSQPVTKLPSSQVSPSLGCVIASPHDVQSERHVTSPG